MVAVTIDGKSANTKIHVLSKDGYGIELSCNFINNSGCWLYVFGHGMTDTDDIYFSKDENVNSYDQSISCEGFGARVTSDDDAVLCTDEQGSAGLLSMVGHYVFLRLNDGTTKPLNIKVPPAASEL